MAHQHSMIGEYTIIFNSKKEFLMLQFGEKLKFRWHFPGGRLDEGENSVKALLREVEEETALEIHEITPVFTRNIGLKPFEDNPSSGKRNIYAVYFTAKAREPAEVKLSSEHIAFKWFKEHEIDGIDCAFSFYKELLHKIFDEKLMDK